MSTKPIGPNQLKMTRAAIDDEMPTTKTLVAPPGKKLTAPLDKRSATVRAPDGRTATADWSKESLFLKDQKGNKLTLVPPDKTGFGEMKAALQDEVNNASSDPEGWFPIGFSQDRDFSGVGQAGQTVSVHQMTSDFEGGAHPNNGQGYQVFDTRTGQRMKLSDVLNPEQMDSVITQMTLGMPKLDESGMDFTPYNDREIGNKPVVSDWKRAIDDNFALVTGGDGKRYIRVAIPADSHVMGTANARFTFEAPTDPDFLAKIGAQ